MPGETEGILCKSSPFYRIENTDVRLNKAALKQHLKDLDENDE